METVINAIKGFNKDMTCTPTSDIKFHYKEGEEYEERNIKACERGYHECEYPLDVLKYTWYTMENGEVIEVEEQNV